METIVEQQQSAPNIWEGTRGLSKIIPTNQSILDKSASWILQRFPYLFPTKDNIWCKYECHTTQALSNTSATWRGEGQPTLKRSSSEVEKLGYLAGWSESMLQRIPGAWCTSRKKQNDCQQHSINKKTTFLIPLFMSKTMTLWRQHKFQQDLILPPGSS